MTKAGFSDIVISAPFASRNTNSEYVCCCHTSNNCCPLVTTEPFIVQNLLCRGKQASTLDSIDDAKYHAFA